MSGKWRYVNLSSLRGTPGSPSLSPLNPGPDLELREQVHIESCGGPPNKSNPNGGTSNKRNQVSEKRKKELKKKLEDDDDTTR